MNTFMVTVLALIVSAYAGGTMRGKRGLVGGNLRIGISSGYGAAYSGYGDYTSYGSHPAPVRSSWNKIPAYIYAPPAVSPNVLNAHKVVDVPRVVNVVSIPQVVTVKKTVTPSHTGFTGYGSGVNSGYFGYSGHPAYSDRSGYSGSSAYPGYSGYASGWW